MPQGEYRTYALALWLLTLLFFVRVLAQALVAYFDVGFLRAMEEWTVPSDSPFSTSGLIPYPFRLAVQSLILLALK
jgi:hypothetical protein